MGVNLQTKMLKSLTFNLPVLNLSPFLVTDNISRTEVFFISLFDQTKLLHVIFTYLFKYKNKCILTFLQHRMRFNKTELAFLARQDSSHFDKDGLLYFKQKSEKLLKKGECM